MNDSVRNNLQGYISGIKGASVVPQNERCAKNANLRQWSQSKNAHLHCSILNVLKMAEEHLSEQDFKL